MTMSETNSKLGNWAVWPFWLEIRASLKFETFAEAEDSLKTLHTFYRVMSNTDEKHASVAAALIMPQLDRTYKFSDTVLGAGVAAWRVQLLQACSEDYPPAPSYEQVALGLVRIMQRRPDLINEIIHFPEVREHPTLVQVIKFLENDQQEVKNAPEHSATRAE